MNLDLNQHQNQMIPRPRRSGLKGLVQAVNRSVLGGHTPQIHESVIIFRSQFSIKQRVHVQIPSLQLSRNTVQEKHQIEICTKKTNF